MNDLYTISWLTFFAITIILAVLALIGTKIPWGISKLKYVFHRSPDYWIITLIVIGVLAFVLVHPMTHSILVVIGSLVYYLLKQNPLYSKKENKDTSIKRKHLSDKSVTFTCLARDTQDLVIDRHRLGKCLFGAPYINHNTNIDIKQNGQAIEVSLTLYSDQYISSLTYLLQDAGFDLTIKANNK